MESAEEQIVSSVLSNKNHVDFFEAQANCHIALPRNCAQAADIEAAVVVVAIDCSITRSDV